MLLEDYEEFSESQLKILEKYVTNTRSHIFVLYNLPEVIKGALFSRYSRSTLGLRSLLLKEFVSNEEETAFGDISGGGSFASSHSKDEQLQAIKRAQKFYDRILDGYGDDSIGELGGAHLAIENISMIAAKNLEDCRIGGSPLEKSTRYIYFDQKVKGEYLFYREPILMTSAYRDMYIDTCNMLFDTYSRLVPVLLEKFEEQTPKSPEVSKIAYKTALRAKVLDCLRGLLPASTLTNMGMFGNGRFFEQQIQKLHCHNLAELQDIGKRMHEELSKVIPSFIRRSELSHRTQQSFATFYETMQGELKEITERNTHFSDHPKGPGVSLIHSDPLAVNKVAAALLFAYSQKGLAELEDYCLKLPEEEILRILDTACSAREMRRHKSPRALERAHFTFEIIADFGAYRDLQRHRLLTQERQFLTCDLGYQVPQELLGTDIEVEYHEAMQKAKQVFDRIRLELPEEAQYVVPMAYHIRWYFDINLRGLQWLTELRSLAAGHPSYRYVAQEMAKLTCEAYPYFERFFKFVDYDGYEMGRLSQEVRNQEKHLRS